MYGFKEVMSLMQSSDGIRYRQEQINKMIEVLKLLPLINEDKQAYEVMFIYGDMMVTEGTLNQESGQGTLFGFDVKLKAWNEVSVDVSTSNFIKKFSYGNIKINEDGVPVGAVKRLL